MADIEKVIKGLEHCSTTDGNCKWADHAECPYIENCKSEKYSDLDRDALELLKKQEPKPIVYTDNPYTGLPVAHCSKCGEHIQLYAYGNGAEQNYCPYCGQAVKWE